MELGPPSDVEVQHRSAAPAVAIDTSCGAGPVIFGSSSRPADSSGSTPFSLRHHQAAKLPMPVSIASVERSTLGSSSAALPELRLPAGTHDDGNSRSSQKDALECRVRRVAALLNQVTHCIEQQGLLYSAKPQELQKAIPPEFAEFEAHHADETGNTSPSLSRDQDEDSSSSDYEDDGSPLRKRAN